MDGWGSPTPRPPRRYNWEEGKHRYCDLHTDITALLEAAQGREPFSTYSNRMMKTGYARMMSEAESAMISINALLILLAWAAIVLATLAFHLYSRYKLSRTLVMLGWFCTFLAPFLLSMIPLRLFIRWDESAPVQEALMLEFRDHYGLNSKEEGLLDACKTLEEDGSIDSAVDMTLSICAYTKNVPAETAHGWGDVEMGDPTTNEYGPCDNDYMNNLGIGGAAGRGYPAIPKNPCGAINGGNGQAWIDQGQYVCNNEEECQCPEGDEANCEAVQEEEGFTMSLDEWEERCQAADDEYLATFPSYYKEGYVALFFMASDETGNPEPISIDQDLGWPASVFVSSVALDLNELHVECGQARRYLCDNEAEKALNSAKAVCTQIRHFLDDDLGTDAGDIEDTVDTFMLILKEVTEMSISLLHSIKSFKIMSSATFALAPALIRAAIRVKTAVPQNTISGMFVIVLPWL